MQQLQRLPRQVLGQEAELLGVLIPRRACGVFVARLAATFASVRFFLFRAFALFAVPVIGAFPAPDCSLGYFQAPGYFNKFDALPLQCKGLVNLRVPCLRHSLVASLLFVDSVNGKEQALSVLLSLVHDTIIARIFLQCSLTF